MVAAPWFVCEVRSANHPAVGGRGGAAVCPELRPPAPSPATATQTLTSRVGPLLAELTCPREADLATSRDGTVALLCHGEIYAPAGAASAAGLLHQYEELGLAFVGALEGSFALLILDARAELVAVVTDRLASRKVYAARHGDAQWLGSDIGRLPIGTRELDATGLACYLANGVVHNGRTLLEGVSALRRASVHRLGRDGLTAEPYWRYGFDTAVASAPATQLQAELGELLVAAVLRRLPPAGAVYLSLSAGYDATGILGAMGKDLQLPGVYCRSYSLPGAGRDDDAAIAATMARASRYEHQTLPSYSGDLPATIARNVALAHGHAHFCEEVSFWDTLGPELAARDGAIFVGDECFGIKDGSPPTSMAEALRKVQIRGLADMPWVAGYLPGVTLRELGERWAAELDAIVASCPQSENLEDYRDYLYLDQRACNVILPWRERFAGAWAPVRFPLLDNAILEFVARLPAAHRRGKQLFKATMTGRYPELFAAPRGRVGYRPDWAAEYARYGAAILDRLSAEDSPLDRYVAPSAIAQLLVDTQSGSRAASSLAGQARRLSDKALRRLGMALGRPATTLPLAEAAERAKLLTRLLVLRATLRERAAAAHPAPTTALAARSLP